ncbi:MAG TPA: vitamin K epoxide reductase family protein [Gemmatimonadales bacterium]|nr:vitamin K epoxide reductase family protein [Gemmatimonadales bacterium]
MSRHRQAIAVLALVGIAVATYLWLHAIGVIGVLKCGSGGCEIVQASKYAELLGIPVAFYGVVGYATLFGLSLVGARPALVARAWPTRWLAVLSGAGFLFTLYLTSLEMFVIHAWCRWCLASAAIITAIFVTALAGLPRKT